MKIILVAGARPNFMKIAPLIRALEELSRTQPIEHLLVHTGQHYDQRMCRLFFDDLQIPHPDINLKVGSGSHAEQVGRTMIAFETILHQERPDWVVVVGDVNATCACSITAKKEHVKLAHVEAGLRSGDMQMPEEINRLVTDRLADLLFTPDKISSVNLASEGVAPERIKLVGNIMIDTLEQHRPAAEDLDLRKIISANQFAPTTSPDMIKDQGFTLVTMHRPTNVDSEETLAPIVDFLRKQASPDNPIVWTVHPRTRGTLEKAGRWEAVNQQENLFLLHPIGYREMLRLNLGARIMLTDSGGLQEECCVLGTPCLTLRFNTERPITLEEHGGPCVLTGNKVDQIAAAYNRKQKEKRTPMRHHLWDGKTAQRIIAELCK